MEMHLKLITTKTQQIQNRNVSDSLNWMKLMLREREREREFLWYISHDNNKTGKSNYKTDPVASVNELLDRLIDELSGFISPWEVVLLAAG